jgi:hypothetical protein
VAVDRVLEDGDSVVPGDLGHVHIRKNLQLHVTVGLLYRDREGVYRSRLECERMRVFDALHHRDAQGFPLFNPTDAYTEASTYDLSGGRAPVGPWQDVTEE